MNKVFLIHSFIIKGFTSILYPEEYGGKHIPGGSIFYELILIDELSRITGGFFD
jgi:hypothetical protein